MKLPAYLAAILAIAIGTSVAWSWVKHLPTCIDDFIHY